MEVSFEEFLETLGLDTDDLKDNEVENEETKWRFIPQRYRGIPSSWFNSGRNCTR